MDDKRCNLGESLCHTCDLRDYGCGFNRICVNSLCRHATFRVAYMGVVAVERLGGIGKWKRKKH